MSYRQTKEELDAEFEKFLKESVSDDSVDLSSPDKQPKTRSSQKSSEKPTVSWWQDDENSSGESSKTPGGNKSAMGLDTLEEEEEKARFFAQIEAGASSAIDYSKMNRELDSSHSTFATELRKENGPTVEPSAAAVAVGESSAHSGSPQYSEDFEDEDGIKESQTKNSKLSPALVRGQLYAQSVRSEVEALQEAYRQIHSVEDCNGHSCLPLEDEGRTDKPVSPPSLPQHAQQSLQPFSTNDSDLPTEEELMRPIRAEDHTRGFTLQPISQELRMFPRVTPSELDLEQPGQSHSRTTEPLDLDLTSSIRKEVGRLMQEQNKHFPQTLSLVGNAKKKNSEEGQTLKSRHTHVHACFEIQFAYTPTSQTSKGSSVFRSCMLSERKLPLAPSRGRFGDSKAAGKMSKAAPPKAPPSTNKSTKKQEQDSGGAAGHCCP